MSGEREREGEREGGGKATEEVFPQVSVSGCRECKLVHFGTC